MNDQLREAPVRSQIALRLLFPRLFLPIYRICNALIVLDPLFSIRSALYQPESLRTGGSHYLQAGSLCATGWSPKPAGFGVMSP